MRDMGGGPASSPRKARKNRCAVAGNDTAASRAAQRRIELESCDEARKHEQPLRRHVEGEGREQRMHAAPRIAQEHRPTDGKTDDGGDQGR
jgi:hypothetical protein